MIYSTFLDMSRKVERFIFTSYKNKENAVNNGHMSAMQMKHAELENKIQNENSRPYPDEDLIHRLKKQKLHLKDTISNELATA